MNLHQGTANRNYNVLNAYAEMNWGRWIVTCMCKTVTTVRNDVTDFVCSACDDIVQVIYPINKDAIEAILDKRPVVQSGNEVLRPHHNWKRGENIRNLIQENIENGLDST